VALYQPKAFLKRAVPREMTVNVCGQVGWKVSGRICASATGSRPLRLEGMQLLSLTLCQTVVSHVPFVPGSQLGEPPGQGGPMLQMAGCVQMHGKAAARPVILPPLQPGGAGIDIPFGCWKPASAGTDVKTSPRSAASAVRRGTCCVRARRLMSSSAGL